MQLQNFILFGLKLKFQALENIYYTISVYQLSKQARIYREAPSPPQKNESKLLCKITENMHRKPPPPQKN